MISREEAVKNLSEWLALAEERGSYYGEEAIPTYKLAIEALEKRMPKKPTIWGDGYADGMLVYDMWDCPDCEKSYEIDYDHYDHCPDCGQAIDWSDYRD